MRDVFVMSFALGKRVLFTIESIINVCFGDTPQTVILCPKIRIHPSPLATFQNTVFFRYLKITHEVLVEFGSSFHLKLP